MRNHAILILLTVTGLVVSGTFGIQAGQMPSDTLTTPSAWSLSNNPAVSADISQGKRVSTLRNPGQNPNKPVHPDRPGREVSEAARKAVEEMKQARASYLERQQKLKKDLRSTIESERERIRTLLKENRPATLAPQLDSGQDFQDRVTELKNKLHEHKEVLEQAQKEAKDETKRRRAGGGS